LDAEAECASRHLEKKGSENHGDEHRCEPRHWNVRSREAALNREVPITRALMLLVKQLGDISPMRTSPNCSRARHSRRRRSPEFRRSGRHVAFAITPAAERIALGSART
jgi:hypothetical protein